MKYFCQKCSKPIRRGKTLCYECLIKENEKQTSEGDKKTYTRTEGQNPPRRMAEENPEEDDR